MKPELIKLGSNFHKLTTEKADYWFSYEALVAVRYKKWLYITEEKFSTTTTKHINKYLSGKPMTRTLCPSEFNELCTMI